MLTPEQYDLAKSTIKRLTADVRAYEARHPEAVDTFERSVVYVQAVDTFRDASDAQEFLTRAHDTLGGLTPLEAVAAGRANEVLGILHAIRHGLPA